MEKPHCVLAVLLLLLAGDATAVERQPVRTIKPLLLRALDRGEAHGVLIGPAARLIAKHYQSDAPIEIDVAVLQPLPDAGCKRLSVTTTQEGVTDFDRDRNPKAPARRTMTYALNFCRDGSIPDLAERGL